MYYNFLFKSYVLFIHGIYKLIFSGHSWPQVMKTAKHETKDGIWGGLLYFITIWVPNNIKSCWISSEPDLLPPLPPSGSIKHSSQCGHIKVWDHIVTLLRALQLLAISLRVKTSPYLVPQSTVWLYDLALLFFLSSHCCSHVLRSPPWTLLASLVCVPTVSSAGDYTVNPSTSFKIFP